jgi:hypothetical protein
VGQLSNLASQKFCFHLTVLYLNVLSEITRPVTVPRMVNTCNQRNVTSVAADRTTTPFTVTRPLEIQSSASFLEHRPDKETILDNRRLSLVTGLEDVDGGDTPLSGAAALENDLSIREVAILHV